MEQIKRTNQMDFTNNPIIVKVGLTKRKVRKEIRSEKNEVTRY
jgi:hypothetical protein